MWFGLGVPRSRAMWRGPRGYTGMPLDLGELRQVVREWEWICNFLRPSRLLGGKTPWEYLMENHREAVSFDAKLSHMYRTTWGCYLIP